MAEFCRHAWRPLAVNARHLPTATPHSGISRKKTVSSRNGVWSALLNLAVLKSEVCVARAARGFSIGAYGIVKFLRPRVRRRKGSGPTDSVIPRQFRGRFYTNVGKAFLASLSGSFRATHSSSKTMVSPER